MPFFYSLFFFLIHVLCIINYWEQRPGGVLAMARKKTHSLSFYPPQRQEKNHQPRSLC